MSPQFKKIASVLLVIFSLICLIGLIWFGEKSLKTSSWWQVLVTNPMKQTNGQTNILILGVAGGNYDGADLTDTMIFLSINLKTGQAVLVPIPRDLWSTDLVAKINSAYHYGEAKSQGGGFILAKSTVTKIVGLPIHYAIKIDLAGLDDIVDSLGGVEVNVARAFDDYKFPIADKENDPCGGDPEYKCRYQHLHFDAGLQLMNGQRALEYVRSRNAQGDEGTDFARSQRQEKLIVAIKNKILSPAFILHPEKAIQFIQSLRNIIQTDVPQKDMPFLVKMGLKTSFTQIKTISIEQFLITPPAWQYENQWVLVPPKGDFSEIQQYLKQQIKI